jgi:hypothetical protein
VEILVDRFAEDGLSRLLGEMPGKERLVRYLQNRARREVGKLDQATLEKYLVFLAGLMETIRTGERFEEWVEAGSQEVAV